MSLVDEALIGVSAGNGGRGLVSFNRTRTNPRGGPDGGNGGAGGSVFAECSAGMRTLLPLKRRRLVKASNGRPGGSRAKAGAGGKDTVVKVPTGTIIRDSESRHLHADLSKDGDRVILARGGQGGFGNAHFKSSTNRRPSEATDGFAGEERKFLLELRLLADVGLVGLPNAGKSSLLAAMTRANPKIAGYPFTTLEPNLGVAADDWAELVIADIPGLIEGAGHGAGCGNRFLRHISRTAVLWHVVDVSARDSLDEVGKDVDVIRSELGEFEGGSLREKPSWLVFNKIDAAPADMISRIGGERFGERCFAVSAMTGEGIPELKRAALERFHERA